MESNVAIYATDTISVDGKTYSTYQAIVRSGVVRYTKVRQKGRTHIIVDKRVVRAILSFRNMAGYAGLSLVEYLRRVFPSIGDSDKGQ